MDDMAIGNPASLVAQLWRFWALFPGVHIAQFQFQVIRNCGVILPDAVHQSQQGKILAPDHRIFRRRIRTIFLAGTTTMVLETTLAIAGWRHAQYDGIVALAAVGLFPARPGG